MTSCKHALLLLAFVAPLIITTHAALTVTWNLQGTTQAGASTSSYPGARYGATTWVDSNGKLWMFSGVGKENTNAEGYLSQLYQYNLASNTWTLVYGQTTLNQAGVYPTAIGGTGTPAGRYGTGRWVDASGNLYLFGGQGIGSVAGTAGVLNDFWMYNTAAATWTWLGGQSTANTAGGSATYPSPRVGAAHWTDNAGVFYLFGGKGYTSGTTTTSVLNDLWSYNPTTSTWTQITATGAPVGRAFASSWADTDGNGWIYGGSDLATSSTQYYSDMWQYVSASKAWTNKAGSTTPNQQPVYPTTPGGLYAAASFHNSGINYMFGGYGLTATSNSQNRDLWSFNTKSSAWTYEYGTQGTVVGSQSNPGARYLPALWKDKSGNIIIFGGNGYDSNGATTPSILGDTRAILACVFTSSCLLGADNTTSNSTANATSTAFSTNNATTGSLTSTTSSSTSTGALTSTTGGTVTTLTATVNLTLGISAATAPNGSALGNAVAQALGVDPKYVTTTVVQTGKRSIMGTYIVVISVFFPNSSAINAVTGGASSNTTAQLATLQNVVKQATNNSAVTNTLAAQGATVTSVSAVTTSAVVVVSTGTTSTTKVATTTTSAAPSLTPSFTPLLQVVVSFAACVFALVVCTN